MKKLTYAAIAAILLVVTGLSSCDKKATTTSTSGIAAVACEAGFRNILSQEIDVFEYIYPQSSIIPYYIDEHAAIDSLLDLNIKLAVTTRTLTKQETNYLEQHKRHPRTHLIAIDAIALIVNPQNTLEQLSVPELIDILTGKITTWDQIWPNGNDTIRVVFDHQGSGTVAYLRDSLMNNAKFGPNVYAQKNSDDVFRAVSANKSTIGILSVNCISSDMKIREMTREERVASLNRNDTIETVFNPDIKVLKVSAPDMATAYAPYQYYIYTGDYPLTRRVYLICTSTNGTLSHGFYSFVTGFQGQKIIQSTGILPALFREGQAVQIN